MALGKKETMTQIKEVELKQCSMCKETKDISHFNKNKASKSGLTYHCKECSKRKYEKEKGKEDDSVITQSFDIALYLQFMKGIKR